MHRLGRIAPVATDIVGGHGAVDSRFKGVPITWVGTEHNTDAHLFLSALAELADKGDYRNAAREIEENLPAEPWSDRHGRFRRGMRGEGRIDTVLALDCAAWGAIFARNVQRTKEADRCLKAVERLYRNTCGSVPGYLPYRGASVYESEDVGKALLPRHAQNTWGEFPFCWYEGNFFVAPAFARAGEVEVADSLMPNRTRFRIALTDSIRDPLLHYVNQPEEMIRRLGDSGLYQQTIRTFGVGTSHHGALVVFDDGSPALTVGSYDPGTVYYLGIGWDNAVLLPRVGEDFEAQKYWVNHFEPTTDMFILLIKAFYESAASPTISLGFAPAEARTALLLFHDVDARGSLLRSATRERGYERKTPRESGSRSTRVRTNKPAPVWVCRFAPTSWSDMAAR